MSSIRQCLTYAVRVGRKVDIARFMSIEDAKLYAQEHSSDNLYVQYHVVYNPKHNVNDYIVEYINGQEKYVIEC